MLKTFSKSLAALFVAAVLMLGLPALSFADEDTSGEGKSLSEFTDVDWNTVTLSLAQDEYTFDENRLHGEGAYVGKLEDSSGNLSLYVSSEDEKVLLSKTSYYYDYSFYSDTEGHEVEGGVTESGTYYVKFTLGDCVSGSTQCVRYVPAVINIKNVDPYDLTNYSRSETSDGTDEVLYVGDEVLNDTAKVFRSQYVYYSCWSFEKGECFLSSDAYTVDSTWYKVVYGGEDDDEVSYEPIAGVPTEYGYYTLKLVGTGDYTGELYTNEMKVRDLKHSSNFYISSETDVLLADYETVNDLQDKLEISAYGKDEDGADAKVLSLDADYKILKWGVFNEDYSGDDEDQDEAEDKWYTEVSLSDKLQGGTYAVKIEPCGDYYGKSEWCEICVNDLSLLDSYSFSFDYGDRSNFVIGLDDLSTSKLKVVASCEFGEGEKTLTQGVDFELGNTWYKYDSGSDGISSYDSIDGVPSEEGPYYAVQAIGKGDFAGQTVYVDADWIYDGSKLSNYNLGHKQYLVAGEGLLPDDLELSLKGNFGYLKDDCDEYEESFFYRTLTLGTDYTVRWGSYNSDGSFQLLDEGKYPEITDDADGASYSWYLKVIGCGDFEGQELDPISVAIHKAVCTHPNAYSIDDEPDCTEIGVSGSLYCPDCGYEVEGERIAALGHDYQEVSGTAKAATCIEDGYEADKKCTRCGDYVYGDTISKLGGEHSYAADPEDTTPAKAATCTEDGYEPAKVCSICGDKVEGKVIPKGSGTHSYVADESDTTPAKDATCTEDGYEPAKVCSICGDKVEGKTIAALGHNYEEVADSAKAATCTEAGKKADEKCPNCGDVVEGEAIAALGHDYKEVANSAKAATCIADGKEADEKCSRCDDVKQGAAIKATGEHSYEADPEDTTPAKAATCTEDGYEPAQVCTVCNNKVEGHVVKATGHTSVVSKAAVAPTYKTAGSTEEKVCSTCGIVLQKQSVIAKLSAKAQSVNVKTATKTVKKAKVKKKAQTVSGAIKVSGAKGKVTYAKASGSGKLKINASNGKITVKKKTKKGTYSIKVRVNVAASADGQFKAYSKTVTVKVKVK